MAGRKRLSLAGLRDTAGGAKRDDRQTLGRSQFEPITIDAENALTVIYMLQSPESGVVLRAIASLDRFGKKAMENLEKLSSLGILEYVLPLIQYEDYLVRRFAQKVIAELCAVEEFRQQILDDFDKVAIFVNILDKEEDVVMHEFSSLTLAHLTSRCFPSAKILQIEGCVETLYARLSSADPDVQKNCLDIIKNLLNEIDGVHYFMDSPQFNLLPILDLTASNYPVIQLSALNVIEQFTSWSMDNRVVAAFRDSSGPFAVIRVMENEDWTDLHVTALNILLKIADNSVICEDMQQTGCLQRLICLLQVYKDKTYLEKILGTLARVSQTESGRKALQAYNMGQMFAEYLQSEWSSVQESACLGVSNMAQYPQALNSIMEANPTIYLIDILTDMSKEPKLREMASYALNILSHEGYRVSKDLLEDNKFEKLIPMLSETAAPSVETISNILQVFIGISSSEKCRAAVINENVVKMIMDLIQNAEDTYLKPASVQVTALECLSSFFVEDIGRSIFQDLSGAEKLIGCLKSRYASIRQWAALLVTQMSLNLDFVKSFIRLQGLQWMIERKDMRYSAPSWESAIEALFRAYLPAKFAFTGRLDLHDLTQEGFFILRHNRKLFFILDDLLKIRASPAYPVYVANFYFGALCAGDSLEFEEAIQNTSSQEDGKIPKGQQKIDSKTLESVQSTFSNPNQKTSMSILLDTFAACPHDPYLPEYLDRLKCKLVKESDMCFRDPHWFGLHPRLIQLRVQALARFVADEMSGPNPDPVCKDHYIDMHINDIRYELETNVIPIGHVRVGSYLERSFLFKILADKVGLPCALVRGPYGRSWVEVAIPSININEPIGTKDTQTFFPLTPPPSLRSVFSNAESAAEEDDEEYVKKKVCEKHSANVEPFLFPPLDATFSSAFPTRLLKANAIVDLVHEPGRILPIGSYEAEEYKGGFLYAHRGAAVH